MYSSRLRSQWLVVAFMILTIIALIGRSAYTVYGALNSAVATRSDQDGAAP